LLQNSMWIADFMKLDVAAKDSKMTDYVKSANGKVYGKACMSQRDCDKIQFSGSDVCVEAEGAGSCCCTTDKCTGSGAALSIALPILIALSYFASF
ncbi:hypothetical protein PMAYCL1PPCAC_16089, partial [Pristionchus mayeri]